MLRYETVTAAPPAVVWPMLARPDRWHEWAWHLRGAWGLGTPEVRAGARGAVRLLGAVPVPVRITEVQAGRSWSWRAGPLVFRHRVDPLASGGSTVGIDVLGPRALLAVVRRTYGPWCGHATRVIGERAATAAREYGAVGAPGRPRGCRAPGADAPRGLTHSRGRRAQQAARPRG